MTGAGTVSVTFVVTETSKRFESLSAFPQLDLSNLFPCDAESCWACSQFLKWSRTFT